jgi:hypothetical protein
MLEKLKKPQPIEEEQTRVVSEMAALDPRTDEYKDLLSVTERLNKVKPKKAEPMSRDVIGTGLFNLALGVGVMLFETHNVWTSKIPLPFIGKKH